MVALTVSNIASTSATLAVQGSAAGASLEVQWSTSPEFMWTLSPRATFAVAPSVTLAGLNQLSHYFFRGRDIFPAAPPGKWSAPAAAYTPFAAGRVTAPAAIVIEPALIVEPEPVVAIFASNEIDGCPARSLNRDDPNSIWMAKKANGVVTLDIQLSGAPIDCIGLLETTLAEACTVTIKAGPTRASLTDNPVVNTGALPFRASANLPGRRAYHSFTRLAAAVQAPWWRIELAGPMPGDVLAATYLVLGLAKVTHNFAVDTKSELLTDAGSVERDRSGNPSRMSGYRGRTVDFEIAMLTEQQYELSYQQLRWRVGATGPVLVVPNSKAGAFLHDRILYGQMQQQAVTNSSALRMTQPFRIQSLI